MNHHVYLTRATDLSASQVPEEFHTQTSDVLHIITDSFSIDEARSLITQASHSAVTRDGRVFIIVTKAITMQAQNALLKLFEEPPKGVMFYLVVSPGVHIIATLLSRVLVLEENKESVLSEEFKHFLASSYAERLSMIAEKTKTKEQSWIENIAKDYLLYADKNLEIPVMKSAVLVNQYLHGSGAAKKMLLEEVALSLPQS